MRRMSRPNAGKAAKDTSHTTVKVAKETEHILSRSVCMAQPSVTPAWVPFMKGRHTVVGVSGRRQASSMWTKTRIRSNVLTGCRPSLRYTLALLQFPSRSFSGSGQTMSTTVHRPQPSPTQSPQPQLATNPYVGNSIPWNDKCIANSEVCLSRASVCVLPGRESTVNLFIANLALRPERVDQNNRNTKDQ